jgi:transcription elongation factor SPT4
MASATDLGYTTPAQARHLRACMVCSIIQLQSKFISSGCPNCEPILSMAASPDTVAEVTSSNFNGMIAMTNPRDSWVAKFQRLDNYVPGVYAVQVLGELPKAYIQDLADAGVRYVARDGQEKEEEAYAAD